MPFGASKYAASFSVNYYVILLSQAPLLLAIGTKDVDVPFQMVQDFYQDCVTERGIRTCMLTVLRLHASCMPTVLPG